MIRGVGRLGRQVAATCAALAVAIGVGGCADPRGIAPRSRRVVEVAAVRFDPSGLSEEVAVEVPPATRSISIVVRGDDDALYAVARFEPRPGDERVGLPAGTDLGAALAASYRVERIGSFGGLPQSARLGLFTLVHPARREAIAAGTLRFRLATDRPARPVAVTVLMPADDGARRLVLDVYRVSERARYRVDDPASVPWFDEARALLAPAGIELAIGRVANLAGGGFAHLRETAEPQEGPASPSVALARRAFAAAPGDGLAVLVVDRLPDGIGGWSLGTPGPPLGGTGYSGVVLEDREPRALGRIAAHEIAHYLGLGHVEDRGASGVLHPDPLVDTRPGEDNLMGDGRRLSAEQGFVLRRSALLR